MTSRPDQSSSPKAPAGREAASVPGYGPQVTEGRTALGSQSHLSDSLAPSREEGAEGRPWPVTVSFYQEEVWTSRTCIQRPGAPRRLEETRWFRPQAEPTSFADSEQ